MKKTILLFACAWLLSLGNMLADEITIADVTVPQGGTAELIVGYSFTSTADKVGFTFTLNLPTGLSLVRDSDGDLVYEKDATSIDKLNIVSAGEGNVAGQPSSETSTIKGSSGTLLTLKLQADASLGVGSNYAINVTNATFQKRENGSVTDINIDDFTFNVTIDEPDDGRIKFDENATKLPTYADNETGDVTMKRTINAGQWSTIVLPFTLNKSTAEEIFGSDVQLYEFSGFGVDYGDNEENVVPLGITINLTPYTMTARKGMTGGKPFLIKTSKDITAFQADGVKLKGSVNGSKAYDEWGTGGIMTGTFVKTTIPEDGLFIYNDKFYYSVGATTTKAFRCWFELGAVLDKETAFSRVTMNFLNEESTGIEEMSEQPASDGNYYDLQGRHVQTPSCGIYVRDGRKVIVK